MDTVNQRIKKIREALQMDQFEFGVAVGLKQGSISDIERGKVKTISPGLGELLNQKYAVNIDYLFSGMQPMFNSGSVSEPEAKYIHAKGRIVPKKRKYGTPVYNADFTMGDVTTFGDEQARIVGYIDLNGFRSCIAFVRVKGSSMYPDFIANDLIGLEPIVDFEIIEYGQPFAIETKTDQRLVKIIRKGKDDEHLILRSANKEFDDISIHKSKIAKLYKVHGPVRDQWQ